MSTHEHRRHQVISAAVAAAALGMGVIAAHGQAPDPATASTSGNHDDSNADVVARVKQALHSSPDIDSRHIRVSTQHGDVILHGFVQDNRALLSAAQIATQAAEGHRIVNRITIKQEFANAP